MLSLQCDINTSESLQGLRGKNELCDVVIVSSGGQQTFAHSCVLACHSSVIASVLQNRLTAQHDWSVLRPLIINIDEVSMKASSQQDMTREVNIIEILISLMYGEVVNIADTHVPALNEFAHVLGLSEQIFASLDGNEGKNFQPGECDENSKTKTSPPKSVLVFSSNSQGKDGAEENAHVEEISEITLANDIFPSSLSKESQEKADESVVESLSGRNQPENLLSFSMLCSESQDDDSNSSKNWNEGDLQYEKHSSTQDQGCNVIICKMEQSGSDESVGRHVTSISKDSQDGSICNVTGNVSDILNITGNAQSHASAYCGETQQLQQQKKQARKSMTCTTCGSAFQKCGDFVKHVLNNQHFTVQCPLCFIQVEDSEGQRLHFALHNQELPFFCVYCDLRFRTRAALTMHTPKHMTSKPMLPEESTDEPNSKSNIPEEKVTYRVVDGGTQRAKRMLVDSKGYTYTVKRQRGENTYWCCAIRTKIKRCRATVSQFGNKFNAGLSDHCHHAKEGGVTSRILATKVKQEACKDVNVSASTIVSKVVSECVKLEKPNYDTLFHNNLIRKANRVRQKIRQEKTTALDFELNIDFMPSTFLRKDLIVGPERHLIFATHTQLKLLASAKMWYLDGNCKIPCQPFMKIFTIHTFIGSKENVEQVPLLYILMSRCGERDYKEVFAAILDQLLNMQQVQTIVADFEKPLWRAVINTFPDVKLQGCAFHWGKAVWAKAQKLGIKTESLKQDDWQQKFIDKVLALPFLPSEHIEPAYSQLCDGAKGFIKYESLMEYIGNTWVSNSLWTVSSWYVFMQSIRSCNDVEGWHHRVKHQLNQVNSIFYNVIWLLLQEAEGINEDSKALSEEKVKKHQKNRDTGIRNKIVNLWDTYLTGTMGSSNFLKKCGRLYSPEITTSQKLV